VFDEHQIRTKRRAEIMSALSPQIAGIGSDGLDGHVSSKKTRRSTSESSRRLSATGRQTGFVHVFDRR
jgi:hypothetical protein